MEEQSVEGTRQKVTGETCVHFLQYLKTEGEAGRFERSWLGGRGACKEEISV